MCNCAHTVTSNIWCCEKKCNDLSLCIRSPRLVSAPSIADINVGQQMLRDCSTVGQLNSDKLFLSTSCFNTVSVFPKAEHSCLMVVITTDLKAFLAFLLCFIIILSADSYLEALMTLRMASFLCVFGVLSSVSLVLFFNGEQPVFSDGRCFFLLLTTRLCISV